MNPSDESSSPRTLLALLVAESDQTHEETVAEFNRLAHEMGESATLSARQFERWLAGELTGLPRPTSRRVAAAYWGRPIEELLGPPVPSPLPPGGKTIRVEEVEQMKRRETLHGVIAGTDVDLSAPTLIAIERVRQSMDGVLDVSNVSPATIERWERAALEYAHSYQSMPPRYLLADVLADFAELQGLLEGHQPIRLRRRLCHVGGQLAVLAGIFFSALGHHREARAWFHTARLAAVEAGDTTIAGVALVRSATVSLYYATPSAALEQAEHARGVLGDVVSAPNVRAMIIQARALARLGRVREARTCVDAATSAFAALPSSETSDTAFGYTKKQFWFTVGNAYTHLGMTAEAWAAQRQALTLYRSDEYLDPTLIHLDRATCLLRQGEIEEACHVARKAILAIPEGHRQGLVSHYLRTFLRLLPSTLNTLPPVTQLGDSVG